MTNVVQIENLTQDDLTAIIRNAVRDELAGVQPEQKPAFLTRAEAATMLHLTLPTLHAYTKSGVIKGRKVGRRVLYSEEDIKAAVQDIPTLKYSRRGR